VPGATGPQAFLTIQWGQEKTYCGGPAALSGTTKNYPDGSAETAEVRNVVDGATVVGVPLGINGNSFNQNVEVKDWLPRKAGDDFETSRDEDAFAAGQKTPKPLKMMFIPTLTADDCSLSSRKGVRSNFRMGVKNYVGLISAGIKYVEGFMGEMVNLGATVPAGTKGDISVTMGVANNNTLSGSDWRYSKVDDHGDRQYWDGTNWQAIPATWSDKPIGTKLLGFGIWKEGGVNHTQFGSLAWPDPIPAWTADQRATASSTMKTWISNIISTWSNKFDLRRDGCASTNQSCCRYAVKIDGVSFTKVDSMSPGTIVVGMNNARSLSEAWSLGDHRPGLAPHEFGHHLGAPDEYNAPTVDTSVNTDGATAGIDPTSLMGSVPNDSIPPIKARHLDVIKQFLANLINAQDGVTWTFTAYPHT
jgi:hypothetical protein